MRRNEHAWSAGLRVPDHEQNRPGTGVAKTPRGANVLTPGSGADSEGAGPIPRGCLLIDFSKVGPSQST